MVFALAAWASLFILNHAVDEAVATIDRIYSGEVPMDASAIEKMLKEESPREEAMVLNAVQYLLVAVWAGSIVDAYIQGKRRMAPAEAGNA